MNNLIMQKQDLVHQIYINTKEQSLSIKDGDENLLNELLDKRQGMIDNIIIIQKQIQNIKFTKEEKEILADIDEELKAINILEHSNKSELKNLQYRIKIDIKNTEKDIKATEKELKNINLSTRAVSSGYLKNYLTAGGYYYDTKR